MAEGVSLGSGNRMVMMGLSCTPALLHKAFSLAAPLGAFSSEPSITLRLLCLISVGITKMVWKQDVRITVAADSCC